MANVDAPGATASTANWWMDPPVTTDKPKDQFGKDTFMKLLVAQLKYQNPMSPADGNEFLAQTAQFSMVEKLSEMSTQTAAIATSQRLMEASNLVGKTITFYDSDGVQHSETVSAAQLDPAGPILRAGAYEVPLALVESVTTPPASGTAAPAPPPPAADANPAAPTVPDDPTVPGTDPSTDPDRSV